MADAAKKIIRKKITVISGGHHGGSWKVALADFMTAMMAFFLVMWLLGQSEETRKRIADYFRSPSLVEYYYQQFGALLTLEKLFQDFVNAPFETLQKMIQTTSEYPNIWDFGDMRLISNFVLKHTQNLLDVTEGLTIDDTSLILKVPDTRLFKRYSSEVTSNFLSQTENFRAVLAGIKNSEILIEVQMIDKTGEKDYQQIIRKVAIERLHKLYTRLQTFILESGVDLVTSYSIVPNNIADSSSDEVSGYIYIKISPRKPSP